MSLFNFGAKKRYGVIVDIGSGSVLLAVVLSDPDIKHPLAIWSHREHIPLKNIDSLKQSGRAIMASLVNAAILFDTEGRKVLKEFDRGAKITDLQCSISAPWSYTVTKTINYQQDENFLITGNLIKDLMESVQKKIEDELSHSQNLTKLGLETIAISTLDITANGYRVENPEGNKASSLTVSQVNAIAQEKIKSSIQDLQNKMFPGADLVQISFMMIFYTMLRQIFPNVQETCLVDVTYEATEIGIVRDETLTYSTHTPFGLFSLAREISEITKLPLSESFAHLHAKDPYAFTKDLPPKQRDEVSNVFEAYTSKISTLFQETGDALSIPKHITLHTELKSEPLLLDIVDKAVKRNIKTDAHVVPIAKAIIDSYYGEITQENKDFIPADTALLLAAQFFHTHKNSVDFRYF